MTQLEKTIDLTARILTLAGLLDLALLIATSVGVAAVGLSRSMPPAAPGLKIRRWVGACLLLILGSCFYLANHAGAPTPLSILPQHLLTMTRFSAAALIYISIAFALVWQLQPQKVFAVQNTPNTGPLMGLHLLACAVALLSGNLLVISAAWIFLTAAHHLQTSRPDGQLVAPLVAWRRWLISIVGDCCFLLAAAVAVALTGSITLSGIYNRILFNPDGLRSAGISEFLPPLIIAAIFIKCAQFPFSFWLIPRRRQNVSWLNLQLSCGPVLIGSIVLLRLLPIMFAATSRGEVTTIIVTWAAVSAGIYAFAGVWQTDRFKAAFFLVVSTAAMLLVLIGGGENRTAELALLILFPSAFLLLFGLMLAAPINRRPFFSAHRPGFNSRLGLLLILCGALNLCIIPGFSASATLGGVFATVIDARIATTLPVLILLWLTIVLNSMTCMGLVIWSARNRQPLATASNPRATAMLPAPTPSKFGKVALMAIAIAALFSCSLRIITGRSFAGLLPLPLSPNLGRSATSLSNPAVSIALGSAATICGLLFGAFIQLAGRAAVRGRLGRFLIIRQAVLLLLTMEQFVAGSVVALLWAAGKVIAALDRLGLDGLINALALVPHLLAIIARKTLTARRSFRWLLLAGLSAGVLLIAGILAARS